MELFDLFKQGGFIMYPLLIFSVAIWIITIQKVLYLMKFERESTHFMREASRIIRTQKLNEMEYLYKNTTNHCTILWQFENLIMRVKASWIEIIKLFLRIIL